jgi:exodeoxyribonuclease V gamma subunit
VGPGESLRVDRVFPAGRLIGSVRAGPVFVPGKLHGARRIVCWVRHLATQLAAGPVATAVHGIDESIEFGPVEGAAERLGDLVALCRRGRAERVPFFPRTSFAFASKAQAGGEAALAAARSVWEGNAYNGARGEGEEAYVALAWRGAADPLDAAFAALAVAILGPMIAATREVPA